MNENIIPRENLYQVTDIPGYSPNISRLISMMNYARYVTLESVKGLTVEQLDYLYDSQSNSIGALLYHIASTDNYFRILSFEERDLTQEEFKNWEAASHLGQFGREQIKGNELKFYVDILNEERNLVYKLLREKDDEWLERKIPYYGNVANYHHLWFHVFEDEINHKGQINWLKKRLNNTGK